MKKLALSIMLVALVGLANLSAQNNYHVYDGSTFSVMFTCGSDNVVSSLQFSAKDSNGEWQWNDFDVTDYADLEDTSDGGFIFYCVDGAGKNFAIDFYRSTNKIIVHACDADLNYTGTKWELKRR